MTEPTLFPDPTPPTTAAPVAHAWCDGACEPNPGGLIGWGFIIRDPSTYVLLASDHGSRAAEPSNSNNIAEYLAAGMCVAAYRDLGLPGPLLVHSDSQLVVRQMKGEWRIKGGAYKRFADRLRVLLGEVDFEVRWTWIRGVDNHEADALSRQCYQ